MRLLCYTSASVSIACVVQALSPLTVCLAPDQVYSLARYCCSAVSVRKALPQQMLSFSACQSAAVPAYCLVEVSISLYSFSSALSYKEFIVFILVTFCYWVAEDAANPPFYLLCINSLKYLIVFKLRFKNVK